MTVRTFKGASAMPAPTWHFLRMNDTDIELDAELAVAHDVHIEGAQVGADAFDAALDAAQIAYDAAFGDKPFLANYEDDQANRLGGLALSRYQKAADAVEAAKDVRISYEQGLGVEASSWLRQAAGTPQAIVAAQGETSSYAISINGVDEHVNAAAIDLIAQAGAALDVNISVDSPTVGSGVLGSSLRIFAAEGARVTVRRVQTLDDSWTDLDDMGLFLADGATVEIYQTVLGAGKSFTGLAGDLRGYGASANVYTHYLGHGTQQLDFNYVLRHHGAKTTCKLFANGVLAGTSSKTLRGTIDLIRGGKGAVGQEIDNVLLVDEGVHNKTVPTILCNEDDVMGTHGATIGHIKPEQLFYLASRGLSQEQAEGMFVTASLKDAWINAADETTRQAVARIGNTLVDNFEEVYL